MLLKASPGRMEQAEQYQEVQDQAGGVFPTGQEPFAVLGDWLANGDDPGEPVIGMSPDQRQHGEHMHSSNHGIPQANPASPWNDRTAPSVTSPNGSRPQKFMTDSPNSVNTSINERIEFLINIAREMGFESLEHATSALHNTKFEEGSVCSNAQRLGRLRRLPNLLDSLLLESGSWPKREFLNFQEAVLKAGESFAVKESSIINSGGDWLNHINDILLNNSDERCREVLDHLQEQVGNKRLYFNYIC